MNNELLVKSIHFLHFKDIEEVDMKIDPYFLGKIVNDKKIIINRYNRNY